MDVAVLKEEALSLAVTYGPKVIAAIIVVFAGLLVTKIAVRIIGKTFDRIKMDSSLSNFLLSLIKVTLQAVVYLAALNTLGVQTTSLIAILGAAGLAIGLAVKDTLSNFASGVILLLLRPFVVGDFVEAAGTAGVVKEVGVFNTTLTTGDNKIILVPNSKVTGDIITNYSRSGTRRIDMVVGIGYEDDLRQAKDILLKIVGADKRIMQEPAPVIAVDELADSSVNFVVRPWVKTSDYWAVRWDLLESIKITLDEAGISIPYPQRTIHHIYHNEENNQENKES